jgi:hypothetical protein
MRNKQLKLSAVLFLWLGLTELQAQTMYVKENTDTQTAYELSYVRKITFSEGNATIHKTDNTTGIYALSGLRYLNFMDLSTTITEKPMPLYNTKLIAYPNPVNDLLHIDLTGFKSKVGRIHILSFEGRVLHEHKTSETSLVTLNMGSLPQGIYICRYSNESEIKTLKIIKE